MRQENQGLVRTTFSPGIYQNKERRNRTVARAFYLNYLFLFDLSKIMAPPHIKLGT